MYMVQFGIFRMAQAVAGVSSAGPMFLMGVNSFQSGNIEMGVFMGMIGIIAFFLPGLLMERLLGRVIGVKNRVITGTKQKLSATLPAVPFLNR